MPAPYILQLSPVVGIDSEAATTPSEELVLVLTPVLKGDAGSGGVSQAYVDNGDAATLVSANAYTDSSLSDKADLVGGLVPSAQLPSFVDDVLEGSYIDAITFNDEAGNPYTPESNKIYVDNTFNKSYRWSGSLYAPLDEGVVLGETSSTAYRGDRGKTAYDHSQATGNPHGTSFSDLLNQSALFNLVYSAYTIGSNVAIAATDTLGQMLGKLQAQVDSKEPSISSGTTAQYWRGDKTWRDFATDVLGTILTGLSTATATAVTAADTVLVGIGKLQAQISGLATVASTGAYNDLTGKPTLPPATTFVNITANRTILTTESGTIFTDTSAGGAQFTFPTPAAAGNGWEVEIWNETGSSSRTTKLNPPAEGQSIDGSTAQLIVYWKQGYRIVSNGSVYFTHAVRATRFYAEGAGTGARARAESARAIAIGSAAVAGSDGALALGQSANATSPSSIAIMGTSVGTDAIAVRGKTSGVREIAIGLDSTTGTVLSSNGGSIALGYKASAQCDLAVAIGTSSVASQIAEMAFPSWGFALSNHKEIVLGNNSMTAASTDYFLSSNNTNSASTANQIICPASSSVAFEGVLVVRRQGSGGTETASWKIEGEMTRQTTDNVSIVASTITALAGMTPPTEWTPSLVADTTNQCLSLKFNMGTTAMNLRGAAMMRYVTLTY